MPNWRTVDETDLAATVSQGEIDAFRADGFAGQYIIVFPDKDAVLVLTTSSSLYQPYMDIIWQYLLPVL